MNKTDLQQLKRLKKEAESLSSIVTPWQMGIWPHDLLSLITRCEQLETAIREMLVANKSYDFFGPMKIKNKELEEIGLNALLSKDEATK